MKADAHPDDVALGAQLHALIAQLNHWSNVHTEARLAMSQIRLLSLVAARQPAHVSDLALADNSSQPGMSMQIQRLERDDLVQRETDQSDARAVLISLTRHGRELLEETRRARAQTIAPVIARLDADSHAGLHNALCNLTHLLNTAADERSAAPTTED